MSKEVFDEGSVYYSDNDPIFNRLYLMAKQQYFNQKLIVDGKITLYEVYKDLGFISEDNEWAWDKKIISYLKMHGWIFDPENKDIDNFVDFGSIEKPPYFELNFNDIEIDSEEQE